MASPVGKELFLKFKHTFLDLLDFLLVTIILFFLAILDKVHAANQSLSSTQKKNIMERNVTFSISIEKVKPQPGTSQYIHLVNFSSITNIVGY